ncbi:glycosyltransferase [Tropicimonas sp. TH_r6]|uniref:glycosyltransferase family 2 protein n=1 Tax=Tropicimonas sp. TH_r6 TaxID=3082085 RepID=UPI0029546F34|nr:glycosyltransferase [Tropicimonas sp. TH_r6]MDV7141400.1 glycosyltransferase [Tropicimonas sp. TH_r6]
MRKLSIIVTSYNVESYIKECLDDIAGQTLDNFEIIVVDDGSTDRTQEIIRDFAEGKDNVKLILNEKNTIGGVATAANIGLDAATGEFIGFADGDDRYDRDFFATLYDAAIRTESDLALCNYFILDDASGALSNPADFLLWKQFPRETSLPLNMETRRKLLSFIAVPWRKIYRRQMIEAAGIRFPVGDFFFEDNPFHWRTSLAAKRCVWVPQQLCQHRVNRAEQTMATVDRRIFKMFDHHAIIAADLEKAGQRETYSVDLANWLIGQASWIAPRCPEELRVELLEAMAPRFREHSLDELRSALEGRGKRDQGSWIALMARTGKRRYFDEVFREYGKRRLMARAVFKFNRYGLVKIDWVDILSAPLRLTSYIADKVLLRGVNARLTVLDEKLDEISRELRVQREGSFASLELLERDVEELRSDLEHVGLDRLRGPGHPRRPDA